jgi:hypothetical protein
MSNLIYVERDAAGTIVGVYPNPQPGFAEEELTEDHPSLAGSGPAWGEFRAERNRRLAACDWTQLADTPLAEVARAAWANYRHLLRELPAVVESPAACDWPLPPEVAQTP